MRRILFLSMTAWSLAATAKVADNSYDFLSGLRSNFYGKSPAEKRETTAEQIKDIKLELEEIRKNSNDPARIKEIDAKILELKNDLQFSKLLKSALSKDLVRDIPKDKWINKDGVFYARIPGSPFVISQSVVDKKIVTKILWKGKGFDLLGEDAKLDFRSVDIKKMDLTEADFTKFLEPTNNTIAADPVTLADGEALAAGEKSFNHVFSKGVLSKSGTAKSNLDARIVNIEPNRTKTSELDLAEDEKKFTQSSRLKADRVKELNQMLGMAAKVQRGDIKLGESDVENCAILVKEAGGYEKLSESAKLECKDLAPKVADKKEAKEEKEKEEEQGKASKMDAETQARFEQQFRQNMALCEAVAQRAANPMPDQQRRTLGEIVQSVMTNDRVVCPTFKQLMSDVIAENFDRETGNAGDFEEALKQEMGMMDGAPPMQGEFIGAKTERVVQDHFLAVYKKTTSRGNMRAAQSELNAKVEAERNQKLMDEKKCLQKMAGGFATLMQLRQSMEPRDEAEAEAVQKVAHYNSLTNMLLRAVNQQIALTNLTGFEEMPEPGAVRVPLRSRNTQGASSVRVKKSNGRTIQQSQGVNDMGRDPAQRPVYRD
jgi:hypothetical protein